MNHTVGSPMFEHSQAYKKRCSNFIIRTKEDTMTKSLLAMTALALVTLLPSQSFAGAADACKGCHNGSVAPAVDALKAKFKTADALVAGAKSSTNPMMKPMQADEAKLKAAAEEIVK
jgi:hypothetical protein